jgi:thioredoxin reductase (NADPH)
VQRTCATTMLPDSATLATRGQQMFPVLAEDEIQRIQRFGVTQSYSDGADIAKAGEPVEGLMVLLYGNITVSRTGLSGVVDEITTYARGSILGELAAFAARPSLLDARANGAVSVLTIAPERMRALLIAEAELGERIFRAIILRRAYLLERGLGGPVIVGCPDDRNVLRLVEFLRRNAHPQLTLNTEADAEANALIQRFNIAVADLPIVFTPNGRVLRNPTEGELARSLGLVTRFDSKRVYDVAIVGAGPAGLSAAVYAASEGLSTVLFDQHSFGGQAGASARIENYLGFPTGISGLALMARAYNQADKFGVEMAIPKTVTALNFVVDENEEGFILSLAEGDRIRARSVIVATGARYRRLSLDNLASFDGSSVHYWASPMEGKLCAGQEVVVVGGGNSAAQAVVFLAGVVRKLYLLVRRQDLAANMSRFLVDRVNGLSNVEVVPQANITSLEGANGVLQALTWRQDLGSETRRAIRHLFLFIGAEPNSAWLNGAGVAIDRNGFVLTGADVLQRECRTVETSCPGVFAVGDIRSGSTKRIATAVGDGAQVVAGLHEFLAHSMSRSRAG